MLRRALLCLLTAVASEMTPAERAMRRAYIRSSCRAQSDFTNERTGQPAALWRIKYTTGPIAGDNEVCLASAHARARVFRW